MVASIIMPTALPSTRLLGHSMNQVLREYGRVVLLFQQIERTIKMLLNEADVSLTSNQTEALVVRSPERFAKQTLGQVVEPLLDFVTAPKSPCDVSPSIENDFAFRVRCHFDFTEEKRNALKEKLTAIVAKRNDLIHHAQEWMGFNTPEACEKSLERLRVLEAEIRPVYAMVRSLLVAVLSARTEAAQLLDAYLANYLNDADQPR